MSKRITPDEVLAAYKATGLKPTRDNYFVGRLACGQGAMCAAAGVTKTSPMVVNDWASQTYGSDYAFGFTRGFDGSPRTVSLWRPNDQRRYDHGYADGQACAAAVFAEATPCK